MCVAAVVFLGGFGFFFNDPVRGESREAGELPRP